MKSCKEKEKTNEVVVQCYHDYGPMMANEAATDEAVYNDPKTKLERNFPLKLHFVLAELARDGYADIASWAPHGRCFIVHKPKDFEARVLSKYAAFWLHAVRFLNDLLSAGGLGKPNTRPSSDNLISMASTESPRVRDLRTNGLHSAIIMSPTRI